MAEKLDPREVGTFEELLRSIVYQHRAYGAFWYGRGSFRKRKYWRRSRWFGGSFSRTLRQYGRRLKGNGGGKAVTARNWYLTPEMAQAGLEAHEAARQKGCCLRECLINCWAAYFYAMAMSESEAETECMRIFAGNKPDIRSAVRVSVAIRKLKNLGVWPW